MGEYVVFYRNERAFWAVPASSPEAAEVIANGAFHLHATRAEALRMVSDSARLATGVDMNAKQPEAPAAAAPLRISTAPVVLGIDPGFAHLGWAVAELEPGGEHLLGLGLFTTKKSEEKLNVGAAGDNSRRARDVAEFLNNVIRTHNVRAICMESESFVRNASAAAKVARVLGVLDALSTLHDIPLVQVSPQQIKLQVCGYRAASKSDMEAAVGKRLVGGKRALNNLLVKVAPSKREHPIDAFGAVLACRNTDVMRALRQRNGL